MNNAIRRLIAAYSTTTASIETHQGQCWLTEGTNQHNPSLMNKDDFLWLLIKAQSAYPVGYYVAYLRYIGCSESILNVLTCAVTSQLLQQYKPTALPTKLLPPNRQQRNLAVQVALHIVLLPPQHPALHSALIKREQSSPQVQWLAQWLQLQFGAFCQQLDTLCDTEQQEQE